MHNRARNNIPNAERLLQLCLNRGSLSIFGILVIATLISITYIGLDATPSTSTKVVFTSIIFRHGERTPTDTYPTDPYSKEVFWPEGFGHLTKNGKMLGYETGVWLRERYKQLLPPAYSPDDLYIVSSDYDRCLMTAQLLLAALYPPHGTQIWNNHLLWQPVPVHTTPILLDQLIVMRKPCSRYSTELAKVKNATVYSAEELTLFEYISQHAGKKFQNFLDVEFLFNTLEIEANRGLQLPDWTAMAYPEPMRTMAAKSLAIFTESLVLKRLRAGPLLKQIINHMTDKSLHKLQPDRKMVLYSGHDITLVSVMRALGVADRYKPDPNAALLIELHQSLTNDQNFVEIFYLTNSTKQNILIPIKTACAVPCTLDEFVDSMRDVIPNNWEEECMDK